MSDVESYQWIGIIAKDDEKQNVAFLTPLAFWNDETEVWEPLPRQARKELFPNPGKVAWPLGQSEWTTELLYSFWVEPTPEREHHNKDRPTYAHYRISGTPSLLVAEDLAQVLNWSAVPRERLPHKLSQLLATPCYTRIIYIQHGQQLYGPIPLDYQRLQPQAYVNRSQGLHVTVYDLTPNKQDLITFQLENGEHLHLLTRTPRGGTEQQDWSPPDYVISKVISACQTLPQVKDLDMSVLKAVKRFLGSPEAETLAFPQAPDTLARARALLKEADEAFTAREEFIDFVLQLPKVQQQINAASQKARESAYQEAQQEIAQFRCKQEEEIERELASLRDEQTQKIDEYKQKLDSLKSEIQYKEEYLELCDQELESKKKQIQEQEKQQRDLEERIQRRLEELRREPLEILSQALLGSWLVGAGGSRDGGTTSRRAPAAPQPSAEMLWSGLAEAGPGETISEAATLLKLPTVRPAAQRSGVRAEAVRACLLALLAGLIPTLSGPYALATLEALSLVLSAGRLCRVPIPLTAVQPLDLFGQLSSQERLFRPGSSVLADVVLWAEDHPAELALVVLEGLDRVPGFPVYVPLLQQYIVLQQRPDGSALPVPLFHPQLLDPNDPYRRLAAFRWPVNLLLAATCDGDEHSLPLPRICESWLAYPLLSPRASSPNGAAAAPPPRRAVAAQNWQHWRQIVRQAPIGEPNDDEQSAGQAGNVMRLLQQAATSFQCDIDINRVFRSPFEAPPAQAGVPVREES
ncbi:hypothetical protein [Thermogemmatispora sp.]|uniref:hypothetical protein n=1 Tax=Thermogemmatispora sp. TaxID=1968838 RepID=UPI0035E41E01